jgi:hypothetical protein
MYVYKAVPKGCSEGMIHQGEKRGSVVKLVESYFQDVAYRVDNHQQIRFVFMRLENARKTLQAPRKRLLSKSRSTGPRRSLLKKRL